MDNFVPVVGDSITITTIAKESFTGKYHGFININDVSYIQINVGETPVIIPITAISSIAKQAARP